MTSVEAIALWSCLSFFLSASMRSFSLRCSSSCFCCSQSCGITRENQNHGTKAVVSYNNKLDLPLIDAFAARETRLAAVPAPDTVAEGSAAEAGAVAATEAWARVLLSLGKSGEDVRPMANTEQEGDGTGSGNGSKESQRERERREKRE